MSKYSNKGRQQLLDIIDVQDKLIITLREQIKGLEETLKVRDVQIDLYKEQVDILSNIK